MVRVLILVATMALACTPDTIPDASSLTPAAASAPIASATGALGVPAGRVVPFERIGRAPPGGASPVTGRAAGGPTVIATTSAEETSALLTNERVATHVTGLPPIGDGAFIAAFAGQKPSSGYDIAVTDVRADTAGLTVWVRQAAPAAPDVVLATITYPVDVIRVDRGRISSGSTVTLRDAATGERLATIAYCGSTRQITSRTLYDPAGPRCVWEAYSRGETAQWLTRALTKEGGPIIRTLRAVPGGLSEASFDDRGDGFARAPGVRGYACAQIARSTADGLAGQTLVWFTLSRCTGDGEDVEVR